MSFRGELKKNTQFWLSLTVFFCLWLCPQKEEGNDVDLYAGIMECHEAMQEGSLNIHNLPTYCSPAPNKTAVRNRLGNLMRTALPGRGFCRSTAELEATINLHKSQSRELPLTEVGTGNSLGRICPFCIEFLDCDPGMHFRVKGVKPLSVLWLSGGPYVTMTAIQLENRIHVELLVRNIKSRTVSEFQRVWNADPFSVAVQAYRAAKAQVREV